MNEENNLSIKEVDSGDVDLMRSLLNIFGDAFEDRESYCENQPQDSYLTNLLSKEYFITLVAIQSGKVVGGLVAYELIKFEQKRSEVYIYDLAVDESFRRMGIATKLINSLKEISKSRGAYVIFVQADYGDEPAIQLYESLGQREEVLHFDIASSKVGKDA